MIIHPAAGRRLRFQQRPLEVAAQVRLERHVTEARSEQRRRRAAKEGGEDGEPSAVLPVLALLLVGQPARVLLTLLLGSDIGEACALIGEPRVHLAGAARARPQARPLAGELQLPSALVIGALEALSRKGCAEQRVHLSELCGKLLLRRTQG